MNWPRAYLWDEYSHIQQIIAHNTQVVARREGIRVTPLGLAYESLFKNGGVEAMGRLYDDELHPTLAASYMAACMQIKLITGVSLDSIQWKPAQLSDEEAQEMRRLAGEVLQ